MIRVLIFLIAVTVALPATAETFKTISGVPRVVDGDTLMFGPDKVRIMGIDAPEPKQDGCGIPATKFLRDQVIDNQEVVCVARRKDKYGSWVGKCSVGRYGGSDISTVMVLYGYARAYQSNPVMVEIERLVANDTIDLPSEEQPIAFRCTPPWEYRARLKIDANEDELQQVLRDIVDEQIRKPW